MKVSFFFRVLGRPAHTQKENENLLLLLLLYRPAKMEIPDGISHQKKLSSLLIQLANHHRVCVCICVWDMYKRNPPLSPFPYIFVPLFFIIIIIPGGIKEKHTLPRSIISLAHVKTNNQREPKRRPTEFFFFFFDLVVVVGYLNLNLKVTIEICVNVTTTGGKQDPICCPGGCSCWMDGWMGDCAYRH